MANCRSCNKPVIWTQTKKGKKMPVDPEPRYDGNVRLNRAFDPPLAETLTKDERDQHRAGALSRDREVGLHVSHFFTCPDAKHHRKK